MIVNNLNADKDSNYLGLHKKTMARILTGIQSSGKPHLGNLLGAILPAIELSKSKDNEITCSAHYIA